MPSLRLLPLRRTAAAAALVSLTLGLTAAAHSQTTGEVAGRDYVPGELLVVFKNDTVRANRTRAMRSVSGASLLQRLERSHVDRVRIPRNVSLDDAKRTLLADPSVAYVQPNYIYTATDTVANDPYFSANLWALRNTGQSNGKVGADIGATRAWDLTKGSSTVVVGVVDTGVDYSHPDLAANMWRNPGEIAGDGRDNDGNGYIDDVHGYDFRNWDGDPRDDHGHGTHCAGTIGAVGNNGVGVTGVAWNVKIVALKFMGTDGKGSTSSALACIDYLTELKAKGVNVVASNNSWGGTGADSALREAIERANQKGILTVCAAGNTGANSDTNPEYPGAYTNSNVISVAATDRFDRRAGFSNYGANSVDLGAPGVDILSTTPNNGYGWSSGTSMAAPHVTGAVALLKAYNPSLTAAQIKDAILTTGDPVADLQGLTVTGRRLNLYNALQKVTVVVAPVLKNMKLTVTPDRALYTTRHTVFLTVRAEDAQSAALLPGTAVQLTVTTPAGASSTLTGTVTADGTVTLSYRPLVSVGTYTVTGVATLSGYNQGTISGSFKVR